ncbi:14549_t:CDS:1, partial [Gigaspora rosea]
SSSSSSETSGSSLGSSSGSSRLTFSDIASTTKNHFKLFLIRL